LCHSDDDVKSLIVAVHELSSQADPPIALIVIDTLARAMGSGDENSSADMGALLRNAAKIQNSTGAHVLLVHHAGKDSTKGARGHSSLGGAVDTAIEVVRHKGTDTCTATLKWLKDGEDGITFSFRLKQVQLGVDDDGDPITTCVVEHISEAVADPSPKLSRQQTQAVELLRQALADHGEPAPTQHPSIPEGVEVVPIERWKDLCRAGGLTESEKSEAFRQAFLRVNQALQKLEIIGEVEGCIWLCNSLSDETRVGP
jgi:hypothetical protein